MLRTRGAGILMPPFCLHVETISSIRRGVCLLARSLRALTQGWLGGGRELGSVCWTVGVWPGGPFTCVGTACYCPQFRGYSPQGRAWTYRCLACGQWCGQDSMGKQRCRQGTPGSPARTMGTCPRPSVPYHPGQEGKMFQRRGRAQHERLTAKCFHHKFK